MIRDKRLLGLTAAIIGSVLGVMLMSFLLNSPIWAVNIGLIAGALTGAGAYWFKDKQERESIRETVRRKT